MTLDRNLAPCMWNDRAVEAQLGDLAHETSCFLFGGGAVEVVVAEVLTEGAAAYHVIASGEDRGGDGADRLLGAAASLQPLKLRL